MSVGGGNIQHYIVGQSLTLVCIVEGLMTPPVALYWEKGNKVRNIFRKARINDHDMYLTLILLARL